MTKLTVSDVQLRVRGAFELHHEREADGVLAGVVAEDRAVGGGDLGREPLVHIVGLWIERQGDIRVERFAGVATDGGGDGLAALDAAAQVAPHAAEGRVAEDEADSRRSEAGASCTGTKSTQAMGIDSSIVA